jgi:hypothetical protein
VEENKEKYKSGIKPLELTALTGGLKKPLQNKSIKRKQRPWLKSSPGI